MSLRRIHRRLMIEELEPRVAPTTYIYTLDDLQNMKNNLAEDYILANDIDASATSSWNGGLGFDPVGDSSNPFRGSFDGQGHIITGLYINRPSEHYVGLFGHTTNGVVISNVGLVNVDVTGGWQVGALVGTLDNSKVYDSNVVGAVSGKFDSVGGLVGCMGGSTVSNSSSSTTVTAEGSYLGGLVGYVYGDSLIYNSYAMGTANGQYYYVGGLVGELYESTISDSYSSVTVSNPNFDYVGGLVGEMTSSTISNSYATGSVTGKEKVGGLVGCLLSSTVSNSYAGGRVTGTTDVGGLAGYLDGSTVSDSYATGNVIGNTNSGGLVGTMSEYSKLTNSYASGVVTGDYYVGGLVGAMDGSTISISHATGAITGGLCVGGLVGLMSPHSSLSSSYASGPVTGSGDVGGLVGCMDGSTVSASHATGSVSGDTLIGGLVGEMSDSTVTNSYANGIVSGYTCVAGGLVGNITNYSYLANSFASGIVNGNMNVGGLVGILQNSTVSNSYAFGAVNGGANVGGLIGWTTGVTQVSSSYWDIQTSGQITSAGGIGKTTAEMKQKATFVGWDFVNTWGIFENLTYPYLRWHPPLFPGKAIAFTDGDGTAINVKLTGPGNGDFFITSEGTTLGYITNIFLENTTDKSTLAITCKGGTTPGTTFNRLRVIAGTGGTGALGSLSFKGVTLGKGGEIASDGGIKTITIGPILDGAYLFIGGSVGNFTGDIIGNKVLINVAGNLGTFNAASQGEGGCIQTSGGIKTINIKTGDMRSDIFADGAPGIGTINIPKGGFDGTIVAMSGGIKTLNINGTAGIAAGSTINAGGLAGIGTITVKGNAPNLILNSAGPVNVLNVTGSAKNILTLGGEFNVTILKSLNAPFAHVNGLTLQATQGLGKLHVHSMLNTIIAAGTTIGDVKISTNLTDSLILGAYGFGPNGQYDYGAGDDTYGYTAGTVIKSVTVGGVMSGTSIAANVLCGPDHYFGTGDDVILPNCQQVAIKSVSLNGRTDTPILIDTFAISGQGTGGTLKIGGVKINMPTTQGDTVFRF